MEATINEEAGLAITCVQPEISFDDKVLEAQVRELVAPYEGIDAKALAQGDLKEAKALRADLRKMSKALNDRRKAVKAALTAPVRAFEERCKEIDAIILAPCAVIDEAVKEQEAAEKQERREKLAQAYADFAPALVRAVPFERILDDKWLNKSFGEKKAENALFEKVDELSSDWSALKGQQLNFPQETEAEFYRTLSLKAALEFDKAHKAELDAISEMKEEVAEWTGTQEEARTWHITVKATDTQLKELLAYFKANNIKGSYKEEK